MDIWKMLGITETTDIKQIKLAYAKKTKEIHPEEQPKEFQRLHDSYRAALSYAKMFQNDEDSNQEELINKDTNQEELIKEKLFINFDSNTLFKHRKKAVDDLNWIADSHLGYKAKTWKVYVDSESFQYVKNDHDFLIYLYYTLQSIDIRFPYARVLFYALEYDLYQSKGSSVEQEELYYLLKSNVSGVVYRERLSKCISIGSFI